MLLGGLTAEPGRAVPGRLGSSTTVWKGVGVHAKEVVGLLLADGARCLCRMSVRLARTPGAPGLPKPAHALVGLPGAVCGRDPASWCGDDPPAILFLLCDPGRCQPLLANSNRRLHDIVILLSITPRWPWVGERDREEDARGWAIGGYSLAAHKCRRTPATARGLGAGAGASRTSGTSAGQA